MKRVKGFNKIIIICITLLTTLIQTPAINAETRVPGRVVTSNYVQGSIDNFRIDAVDPPWVDGDFINQFLLQYPGSKLQGYGHLIKEMADKHGVNTALYMGQIGLETTFGKADCGGPYNFGCYMWASWMGVGMVGPSTGHNQYDRDWANPPTVERGIEIQMELVRNFYINRGLVLYADYLEVYSPSFENDHYKFKSLMWGVLQAFGQDPNETRVKTPGGVANNIQLPVVEAQVNRGDEVDINLYNHTLTQIPEVSRVEFMNHINTDEIGRQTITLFVFFSDNTFKLQDAILEVLPKTIEVGLKLPDGQTIGQQTVQEGQEWTVDVTGYLEPNTTYGVINNDVERASYHKNPLTYVFTTDQTATTFELEGRVYITMPATLNEGVRDIIEPGIGEVTSQDAKDILDQLTGGGIGD